MRGVKAKVLRHMAQNATVGMRPEKTRAVLKIMKRKYKEGVMMELPRLRDLHPLRKGERHDDKLPDQQEGGAGTHVSGAG